MDIQSRLTTLQTDQMSEGQQRVLAEIQKRPRGNLDGPFLAWVRARRLQTMRSVWERFADTAQHWSSDLPN
ncbi:hypothetical protein [Pseudomonas sp. Bc-h]|uniref:hypothetical protein n=1 Tax=Pseudomonas sp. Bc-h TaxID=1943632 RepID=UPI0026D9717C